MKWREKKWLKLKFGTKTISVYDDGVPSLKSFCEKYE